MWKVELGENGRMFGLWNRPSEEAIYRNTDEKANLENLLFIER